jgi:L-asparaginase II
VRPAPLVRVIRSGLAESVHTGHVAVCDARGKLVAWVGDPGRVVFVRSCMKPVQAAVGLSVSEDQRLPEDLIAVMCASHNGEPVHIRAVRRVLRRGGLTADDLQTPPDRPIDPQSASNVRRPAPIYHNCSGKHAGMLLACVRGGWPTLDYRRPTHPLQRRVLAAVRELSGVDAPVVGVDGCGVPVHGMALRSVATMYARLGDQVRPGDLAATLDRATRAMRAHPYLVGGKDRDDTAAMQAVDGLVMKEGAEALDCAVHLPSGLGVAVKVEDGGYRAAGPAIVAVLEELGIVDARARRRLDAVAAPAVEGGGRPVGRLEAVVSLHTRS